MIKVIGLIVGMFVISCGGSSYQDNSVLSDNKSDSSILAEMEIDYSNEEKIQRDDDFLPFWIAYRDAVLEMDSNQLIKIIKFPLILMGYEDNDPIIKVSKSDFFFVFNIFLNTGGCALYANNLDDIAINNLDFIKRSLNARNTLRYEQHANYHAIGDQVFEKIEGKWMLTSIYIDTKGHNFHTP